MSRILPFLFLVMPFVVFWAYVKFAVSYRERFGRGFYATHWYWVALVGALGFVACYLALWAWREQGSVGRYVPSHVENGIVVPGRFEPLEPGSQ